MSFEDPFDTAEVEAEPVADAVVADIPEVPAKTKVGDGEGKIVLTFKEGAGYDASWTVVHASTVAEANAILSDPEFKALLDRSKKVASYYRGGSTPPQQAAAQPGTPPGSQEAPGGEKRYCNHGEMVYKSGVSKAGNAYRLFSCTAPREQQCKAQYLK